MSCETRAKRVSARRVFVVLCLSVAVAGAGVAHDLPGWSKHPGNPVLPVGEAGEWDQGLVLSPSIVYDGQTYHMWYLGGFSFGGDNAIGYATSADGVSWTKHPSNPVLEVGPDGSWDSGEMWEPSVISNGDGTYTMWYAAELSSGEASVGVATSADGVSWTKHPSNPVLIPGSSGQWDHPGLGNVSVVFDGETYHMWYVGFPIHQIGYATSADGIAWTKHPDNPVFVGRDDPQAWDQCISSGAVFSDGETFHMLYTAGRCTTDNEIAIGYASSTDGAVWTRSDHGGQALSPGMQNLDWDACHVGYPGVVAVGELVRMYYTHFYFCSDIGGLGLATASMDEIAARYPRPDALNDNRFRINASWWDADGNAGIAAPVRLTNDTGYFWFFDEANLEVVLKVLDGCAINGHYWVFAAGMTNVGVTTTVTDTMTDESRSYVNTLGEAFQPVQDTAAFACE